MRRAIAPEVSPSSRPKSAFVPARARRAATVVSLIVLLAIVLGHDGRRVAQVVWLAVPWVLWLLWPLRSGGLHHLRGFAVWAVGLSFVVDGMVRAYLFDTYRAAPDSSLVLAAVANTNLREVSEYLAMHAGSVALAAVVLLAAAVLLARYAWRGARGQIAPTRWHVGLLVLVLLLSSVAYVIKPWRRLHPWAFWPQWNEAMLVLREGWADRAQERTRLLARAHAALPQLTHEGPSTVVLVITESINRDNLALYGYARATTPTLMAQKERLRDELLVLRHAWSVDASTLPALRNMLHFGAPQDPQRQHVLAMARAAGYKVWWISNHDDVGIEQEHALLADTVDFVNRTPGRAGVSLDGELLDCLREALAETAPRKLIVVHLLGAHPHYALRFPAGANPFDDEVDPVDRALADQGRSARVRRYRQQYDAALLYHDAIVSQTLELTRAADAGPDAVDGGYRAWMYLSDHGQEVGHESNHAGHSPMTEAGYRIPTLIWRSEPLGPQASAIERRPFRADWSGWTLASLLRLQWSGQVPQRDVLDPHYRWVAPTLPLAVSNFED